MQVQEITARHHYGLARVRVYERDGGAYAVHEILDNDGDYHSSRSYWAVKETLVADGQMVDAVGAANERLDAMAADGYRIDERFAVVAAARVVPVA